MRDLVTLIEEILGEKLDVDYTGSHWEGHYKVTPYSYQPNLAKKLTPNPFVDLGQGITACIEHYKKNLI